MVNHERIKQLLGIGLSGEVVATTVGCDPSYISQLMSDENFKAEIIALRSASLTADSHRDSNIGKLEDRAITKLEEMLEWVTKPGDMLRFFQVLNAAKRRGVGAADNLVINQQIVQLQLPTAPLERLTIDGRGEVVAVGDQDLITMQPAQLVKQLVAVKGESDASRDIMRRIETRQTALANYGNGTDAKGNSAKLSSGAGKEAFDI